MAGEQVNTDRYRPVPTGDLSPWQKSVTGHPLNHVGRDEALPADVDVVIIGSGLTGALIAHTLAESPHRPAKIILLEAREICSGATGRNAGHCRPDPARGFLAYSANFGDAQARKILESEPLVLQRTKEFIERHNIDCEFTYRDTYDMCMTPEYHQLVEKAIADYRAAGGTPQLESVDPVLAKKIARCEAPIYAGYLWKAATLNPSQLCFAILTQTLAKGGFQIFAHTPVQAVSQNSHNQSWDVKTPRGTIRTTRVVYATNGYTESLVPELRDLIVPRKGQAVQITKAPAGPEAFPPFSPSLSMRYRLFHYYSVACRPDQSVVIGTSRGNAGIPIEVLEGMYNSVDDAKSEECLTRDAYKSFGELFPSGGWTEVEGLEYAWTGVQGLTPDNVPFIGPVPGRDGQFIAAGFCGHGMARIFLCAPALATFMMTDRWDPAMPEAFLITTERIQKLRQGLAEGRLNVLVPTG